MKERNLRVNRFFSVAGVFDGDLLSRLNLEVIDTWRSKPAFFNQSELKATDQMNKETEY